MKLCNDELRYMTAFESISGVNAKDCIISKNRLVFLVNKNDFGKAVGRNGSNVKQLSEKIGKSIELMEYNNDASEFVKKALSGIRTEKIEITYSGKKTMQLTLDSENKRKALNNIGRIKKLREIVKREFNIDDIRIR